LEYIGDNYEADENGGGDNHGDHLIRHESQRHTNETYEGEDEEDICPFKVLRFFLD
jgi:hypothetical protein